MITAQQVKQLRDMTGAGMMDCKKALVATSGDIDKAIVWLRERGIAKAAKKESRIAAEGACCYKISGNKAVIYEVNSETDFVAKNPLFKALCDKIGDALINSDAESDADAMNVEYNGEKVADMLIGATATIGEKIGLRRVSMHKKTESQVFGAYSHMQGKIVVLTILDGSDADAAKDVAMHVAAMDPRFLNRASVDAAFLASETEIIRQETFNENKEAERPKPEQILEKIVAGRVAKMLKEICLVDQEFVKAPEMTVGAYLKAHNSTICKYVRVAVGEGIQKKKDDFVADRKSVV